MASCSTGWTDGWRKRNGAGSRLRHATCRVASASRPPPQPRRTSRAEPRGGARGDAAGGARDGVGGRAGRAGRGGLSCVVKIGKRVTVGEETLPDGGRAARRPVRTVAAVAVIENPFAGKFVEELTLLVDA